MYPKVEVSSVFLSLTIERIIDKEIRGKDDNNEFIYETDLQIKLVNTSTSKIVDIECKLEYLSQSDKFLGFDDAVSFSIVKPLESVLLSIPIQEPEDVFKRIIDNNSKEEQFFRTALNSYTDTFCCRDVCR